MSYFRDQRSKIKPGRSIRSVRPVHVVGRRDRRVPQPCPGRCAACSIWKSRIIVERMCSRLDVCFVDSFKRTLTIKLTTRPQPNKGALHSQSMSEFWICRWDNFHCCHYIFGTLLSYIRLADKFAYFLSISVSSASVNAVLVENIDWYARRCSRNSLRTRKYSCKWFLKFVVWSLIFCSFHYYRTFNRTCIELPFANWSCILS